MFNQDNFEFKNINSCLNHLSAAQIVDLVNQYCSGVKNSELIELYDLDVTASKLISIFPLVKTNIICEFCGIAMVTKLNSKTSNEKLSRKDLHCSECMHVKFNICNCSHCIEKKEIEQLQRRQAKEFLNQKKMNYLLEQQKKPYADEACLTLIDKIYLAGLLRECLCEDAENIQNIDKKLTLITPQTEFTIELIQHLILNNFIVPTVQTDLESLSEQEDGSISYFIDSVVYRLNIRPKDNNRESMLHRLMYPRSDEFLANKDFCYEFWKKIAFYESLQYLLFKMNSVRYDFSPGKKTIAVLKNLVNNFSVGQIYSIIYRAIANSTEQYQSGKITKLHAQNMVISSCESMGERALANNWDLTNYSRVKDLPQSQISKIFYDSILQISYLGFSEKPTSLL